MQIDAKNLNTGGSSGSGKSTIFNSLEYLLGTNSLPSTVLQSRLTKEPMLVSADFDMDGKNLTITRGKAAGLSISLDGVVLVSGNNKAAEEKLDEILGIPRDLLRKMIHKRQKEGGFFLGLTPKECHEFLIQSLDLNVWSKRLEKIEMDKSIYTKKAEQLKILISGAKDSLGLFENSLSSMTAPFLNYNPSVVEVLENSLKLAKANRDIKVAELKQEMSKIVYPQAPESVDMSSLSPMRQEIVGLKAQEALERKKNIDDMMSKKDAIASIQKDIDKTKNSIDKENSISLSLSSIKEKILSIKNAKCPTCEQHWSKGQSELDRLIQEAKNLKSQLEGIDALKKDVLPKLEMDLESAKKSLSVASQNTAVSEFSNMISSLELSLRKKEEDLNAEQKNRLEAYNRALESVRNQEKAISEKFETEIRAMEYDISEKSNTLIRTTAEVRSFSESLAAYNKNIESLKNNLTAKNAELTEYLIQQSSVKDKLIVVENSHKVLKGYINSMFHDSLASIAHKATEILSRIPNMATASIYFEGFKETKSGTIKEEVTAILSMDGEIDIPVKSMSGGERTAIDLAVDLAVIDMIEERVGKGLDIFVLDEPFDGLDSVCREQCLEILKTHVTGKKIVLVDHSNETKEMVSDRIVVIRDGQSSTVHDTVIKEV